MKTKVTYLASKIMVAVILVAILVVKVSAADAPKLKMLPHTNDRAIIVFDNNVDQFAELTIENIEGDILYYKEGRIDEGVYSKIFDFKNLTDGSYKITVKNSAGTNALNFRVDNNNVIADNKPVAIAPSFIFENNVLKISYLNHTLNNVAFTLANENGELYKKSLGNNFSITTGFKFSNLEKGNYAVSINDGSNTFNYAFQK